MGWLTDRFGRAAARRGKTREHRVATSSAAAHLEDFLRSRRGVEGWVELPTNFNKPSLVLIAHDGEWTRRSVPSAQWAHQWCARHGIPGYDAGVVSYPQRMRDYNAGQKGRRTTG